MRVPMVKLTQMNGSPCWVNMSRVQEMYPPNDPSKKKAGTTLVMNIPNYTVEVVEPPQAIVDILRLEV